MAETGTNTPFAVKEWLVRRSRRISETRVLWVATVLNLGTMLSVEHDTTARPVHDRARARPPSHGGRMLSRARVEGLASVTTICLKEDRKEEVAPPMF